MIDVEHAVTNLLAAGIGWTSSAELVRPAARLATELGARGVSIRLAGDS